MENKIKSNDQIDVSQIVDVLRRNWWMFAVSVILCGALGVAYLYVKHSVYVVHAKVCCSCRMTDM